MLPVQGEKEVPGLVGIAAWVIDGRVPEHAAPQGPGRRLRRVLLRRRCLARTLRRVLLRRRCLARTLRRVLLRRRCLARTLRRVLLRRDCLARTLRRILLRRRCLARALRRILLRRRCLARALRATILLTVRNFPLTIRSVPGRHKEGQMACQRLLDRLGAAIPGNLQGMLVQNRIAPDDVGQRQGLDEVGIDLQPGGQVQLALPQRRRDIPTERGVVLGGSLAILLQVQISHLILGTLGCESPIHEQGFRHLGKRPQYGEVQQQHKDPAQRPAGKSSPALALRAASRRRPRTSPSA